MLYILLGISGMLTWFALKEKVPLMGILAGGAWFVFLAYVNAYPPGGLVLGDNIHRMLILILVGVAVSVPIMTIQMARSKEYDISVSRGEKPTSLLATVREADRARHGSSGKFAESPEEYKERVHNILKRGGRR